MKFLHTTRHELHEFLDSKTPGFAILSHTVALQDDQAPSYRVCGEPAERGLQISEVIVSACKEAQKRGLDYLWVHSLCVDKSSSAELDEAVNGAFNRLCKASVCLGFLHDLPSAGGQYDEETWKECLYWRRSWTLQELLVPSRVEFFDADWNHRGSKSSPPLSSLIQNITGIPEAVLCKREEFWDYSLATRMSWASKRESSREEDIAYSLAAITGVTLSLRYGEGATKAFIRLQEAILQDTRDGSILAWCGKNERQIRGLLAHSPSEFRSFAKASAKNQQRTWLFDGSIRTSSKGVEIQSRMACLGQYILVEIGRRGDDTFNALRVGIWVMEINGVHVRVNPATVVRITGMGTPCTIHVTRDIATYSLAGVNVQLGAEIDSSVTIPPGTGSRNMTAIRNRLNRCVSPSYSIGGAKRDRFGQPKAPNTEMAHPSTAGGEPVAPGAEEEIQEASADSLESDVDMESGSGIESSGTQSPPHEVEDALIQSHEYRGLRTEFVQLCCGQLHSWLRSSAPVTTEMKENPPKRTKMLNEKLESVHLDDSQPSQDQEKTEVAQDLGTSFNLACPFYASNPDLYGSCLIQRALKSIKDVKKHIIKHHIQPAYCPICRLTFDNSVDRDRHIIARSCEIQSPAQIEGVDPAQLELIKTNDDATLDEEERWHNLFSIIFSGTLPSRSPYLNDGNEPRVSRVRDYWLRSGSDFVSQQLQTRELPQGGHQFDQGEVIAALKKLIFESLVEMVMNDDAMFENE